MSQTRLNMKLLLRRAAFADTCVLDLGEPGYHTGTKEFKIGDGTTQWSALPIANKAALDAISARIDALNDTYATDAEVAAIKEALEAAINARVTLEVYNAYVADHARTDSDTNTYIDDRLSEFGINTVKPLNDKIEEIKYDYTTAAQAGTIAEEKIAAFKTSTVDPIEARVKAIEDAPYATQAYADQAEADAIATVIGVEETDTADSATIIGAKKYADARKAEVVEMIDGVASAGLTRSIVTELPATDEAAMNTIYMIKRAAGVEGKDVYDEYILIEVDGTKHFELLGNTELDLSNYYTKDEVDGKNYKVKQTAVNAVETAANTFIDTVAQNENGEVVVTTKAVDFTEVNAAIDKKLDNLDGAITASINDSQSDISLGVGAGVTLTSSMDAGTIKLAGQDGTDPISITNAEIAGIAYGDIATKSDVNAKLDVTDSESNLTVRWDVSRSGESRGLTIDPGQGDASSLTVSDDGVIVNTIIGNEPVGDGIFEDVTYNTRYAAKSIVHNGNDIRFPDHAGTFALTSDVGAAVQEAIDYVDSLDHQDTTYTVAATENPLEFTVTPDGKGSAQTITLVAPTVDTGVMQVVAGEDIVVTPAEGTGTVTIAHETFTTGTYQKSPESSDKTGDVYMMTSVTVDNGHVTGANVQSLAHALQEMSFIFDGGTSAE